MKTKTSLCLAAVLISSTSLLGQLPTKYVKWTGDGDKFANVYNAWTPGKPLYPKAEEDENFFISRIKFRPRFTNQATQVDKDRTQDKDKHVLNWVPIGTTNDGNTNALPSAVFDSDVFSTWSYLTHYGNWTAPLVRMPGAFMDIAHKNGVGTSVLSSIPWAKNINPHDGSYGSDLASLYNGGSEKFLALLKQYGLDGWGMNSEFHGTEELGTKLQKFMADVYEAAITNKRWPQYAAIWYTLVVNNGGYGVADGLTERNIHWFHKNGRPVSNYVFGNYGWDQGKLAKNDQLAKSVNRDPRDVYAGMNLQGAEGRRWQLLENAGTSIGLWGAHNRNMFFESRNELGSSPETMQRTYLSRTEGFFGNGSRNPAIKLPVQNKLGISVGFLKDFHGLSAFATAKSSLQWDLGKMPFFTFFNLGNGRFYNIEGKTMRKGEWYNIGMQDYLPTWRYWFSKKYLGSAEADVKGLGLSATFTWDDAWFGGSSFQIKGTAESEYLHLFKTEFALKSGDKIRLRYKFKAGSAGLALVASSKGKEQDEVQATVVSSDDVDLDEWATTEITVGDGFTDLNLAGQTMAAVALKFENAKDMELLIGEFSIVRGDVQKPAKPAITEKYTKAYNYSYKGIDGKIIFNMPTPDGHPKNEVVYNEDVKTAFFKLYSQQEGEKEYFIGTTTSWAGLYFSAPFDVAKAKKVRFGVSAVGLDGVTEGEIAWSEYKAVGTQEISETIVIDKPVIKPEQDFTVQFEDPTHADATWEILDDKKQVIQSFPASKKFTHKLPKAGIYSLKYTVGGETKELFGFIQVSDLSKGAVPSIKTLTFNGSDAKNVKSEQAKVNELAYTGNSANGAVSRGISLSEQPYSIPSKEVGLTQPGQTWSLALWVKFNSFKGATQLLNVRDVQYHEWPQNNWGNTWSVYDPNSKIYDVARRKDYAQGAAEHHQKYRINFPIGAWTHLVYVFEKKDSGLTIGRLYVNGKPAEAVEYSNAGAKGQGLDETGFNLTDYNDRSFIYFGGTAAGRAGVDGVIDDVKFYDIALTEEQVAKEMYSSTLPQGTVGYWDFESEMNAEHKFTSKISKLSEKPHSWTAIFTADPQGAEGRFIPSSIPSSFEAGSPYLPGELFKVETTAKWSFPRGAVTDATGNDVAGSAKVTYAKKGVFTGKLTLVNSWGTDSREIDVITITDPGRIETTDEVSLAAFPNPFVETVNVRFATAGKYQIAIYDLSGSLVSRKAMDAESGSIVAVNLDAPAGIYLLRVQTAEGKLLQTLKLQKK
ncbi:MAG: LamG-like jellyroll fold domain-containing protein [Porphyromonadaceae bacterium]|nr:LamG-like jellyroll fold domain-containing protein [Porphyromonadaceae bacterium]